MLPGRSLRNFSVGDSWPEIASLALRCAAVSMGAVGPMTTGASANAARQVFEELLGWRQLAGETRSLIYVARPDDPADMIPAVTAVGRSVHRRSRVRPSKEALRVPNSQFDLCGQAGRPRRHDPGGHRGRAIRSPPITCQASTSIPAPRVRHGMANTSASAWWAGSSSVATPAGGGFAGTRCPSLDVHPGAAGAAWHGEHVGQCVVGGKFVGCHAAVDARRELTSMVSPQNSKSMRSPGE